MKSITLTIPQLEAQITELAGHLNSANYRLLELLAEFDRRTAWAASGTQSCAHWLNWKCGIDVGAAREKVRVANALVGLPRISAAVACGKLSYSKVRALTRVAAPETEELLLTIALHGTAHHVETTVRCFRRAKEVEELSREAMQQAARKLTYFHDSDGSLIVRATLPAEAGALFKKAIDAAIAVRSSCTSTPRLFGKAARVDASMKTALPSPWKPRAASAVMPAWCPSSRTRMASR